MKKHRIVKKTSPVSLLLLLLLLLGSGEPIVVLLLLLVGLPLCLWELLFDFPGGRFTVDTEGINTYIGFRCYKHPWAQFAHCGLVYSDVSVGVQRKKADWHWVYLSTRSLTNTEEKNFLQKTYKDYKNIFFFQYDEEKLQLLLTYAPENLRSQLESLPRPPKGQAMPSYRVGRAMQRKQRTQK